jgi:hypothetical protein
MDRVSKHLEICVVTKANGIFAGTTKVGELCFTFPKSTSCAKRRTTRDGTDIIECKFWPDSSVQVTSAPCIANMSIYLPLYSDNCDVRIYPGETEFRAAVYTKDGQVSPFERTPRKA